MSKKISKKNQQQSKAKQEQEANAHGSGFFKKALIAFLLLSVVGTTCMMWLMNNTPTTQYPEPTSIFYVEDYSGVFTEETENYLREQALELQSATKAQIVVVAVPNTHTDSLEDYSYNLAKQWGIGDGELDNGVLLLFTTEEPHVRLEIGRGLEGCLTDSKSGRILDTWAVEAKDAGRWNEAAINTFVAVAQEVYAEYGLEAPDSLTAVDDVEEYVEGTTLADADFPEPVIEENQESILLQILSAFIGFWFMMFGPFIVFCVVIYFGGPGNGKSSRDPDAYLYEDNYSSYDSGDSGGGGDFGGGGASR